MKKKHLKNLTKSKVLIESLKTSIFPYCVSASVSEEEINAKDIQAYIANGILEVVDMEEKESIELRRKAWQNITERSKQIDKSFLLNVKAKKPEPESVSINQSHNSIDMQSSALPTSQEGMFVSQGNSPVTGQVNTTSEMIKNTDAQMTENYRRMMENLKKKKEAAKKSVETKTEKAVSVDKESVDSKIETAVSIEPEKKESNEVEEFGSLPFFSKKSKINKCEDEEFLKALLKSEKNETVLALIKQKLEEL